MSNHDKTRKLANRRCGESLAESTLVLLILVFLILGTLDLGMMVFRYNTAAELARIGARAAIVRGADAPPRLPAWDQGSAPAGIRAHLRPLLDACGISDEQFHVTVEYEVDDEGVTMNEIGAPVTVTVGVDYTPFMTMWRGGATVRLSATSRMAVAN